MAELCLMASTIHPLPGFVSKGHQLILPCHGANQDFAKLGSSYTSLQEKVDWKPKNPMLRSSQIFWNSTDKRDALIGLQGATRDAILFSFGIAEQCIKREKIMKLLTSGSTEVEGSLLDLTTLFALWDPQPPITDFPQHTVASHCGWCYSDNEPNQSLVYPKQEFHEAGDLVPEGQLYLNGTRIQLKDIVSVINELHLLKNSIKSSNRAMVVPYFERRRRGANANANKSKLETMTIAPTKSPEKAKDKTQQKKKKSKKSTKDIPYSNNYLHACESLLSIMVNRNQQGQSIIHSLKKSNPELPHLLTQFSATLAGTGIALFLSVVCKVSCGRIPFNSSKVLTTGMSFSLVWLSWAVNKLRETVINCVGKNSGKLAMKEEEVMSNLDRTLKDVYFRAATILAIAMLKVA